jgi:hypothetical protein
MTAPLMTRNKFWASLAAVLLGPGRSAIATPLASTAALGQVAPQTRITSPLKYSALPKNILAVGNERLGIGSAPSATSNDLVDGINSQFTLAEQPYVGSLQLSKNGLLLSQPEDYSLTLTGPTGALCTFTAAAIPQPGDSLRAYYLRSC